MWVIFADSRMEPGAKISIKFSSLRSFFTQCIQQQFFEVLGKNTFIRSKLPTAVCWSREEREEGVKSEETKTDVCHVRHDGCRL